MQYLAAWVTTVVSISIFAGCGLFSTDRFIVDTGLNSLEKPLSLSHPDSVLDQIEYSWGNQELVDYEEVLDEGYIYQSVDPADSGPLQMLKQQEIATLEKIFNTFDDITLQWETPDKVWLEYGENAVPSDVGNAVIIAPNGEHADEVWTIYRVIGEIRLANTDDLSGLTDGFDVVQRFELSFRPLTQKDGETVWRLREWVDLEPLGAGKPASISFPNLNAVKLDPIKAIFDWSRPLDYEIAG